MTFVKWNGDEVVENVVNAAKDAIDETTEAAAKDAASSHWWSSRGGQLESEIVSEPAKVVDGKLTGKFGTTKVRGFYGLFLERRTPFLRPAADRVFSTLTERIKGRL